MRTRQLWQPGAKVVLACSGGLDSMVALALLVRLRPSLGHELAIAHVDHGLWAHSDNARQAVADRALAHGLPFGAVQLHLAHGADLENRARLARYAALERLRGELGGTCLATAHHADDQAETLLLRMARGCGPEALIGIRAQRDGDIVRPVLGLSRADLRAVAEALQVTWVEDLSNGDDAFSRNRLRHDVLPVLEAALPGSSAGLARTASHLADGEGVLDAWMARALTGLLVFETSPRGQRRLSMDVQALPTDAAMLGSLLHHVCRQLGCQAPSLRAVQQFCAVATAQCKSHCDIKGLRIERHGARCLFTPAGVARPSGAD